MSQKEIDQLIAERSELQYTSLADFLQRSKIKKEVLSRMALAGGFSEFNWSARESLWALLEYQNLFAEKGQSQLNFFKDLEYSDKRPQVSQFEQLNGFEKIQNDYSAYSVSLHGHPMQELRKTIPSIARTNSKLVKLAKHNSFTRVSGLVLIRQKPPTANGVCFSTIEDEMGFLDLVLWKDIFEKYQEVFLNHCFITVEGKVQKDSNTVSIIVSRVTPVWNTKTLHETPLALEPDQYFY